MLSPAWQGMITYFYKLQYFFTPIFVLKIAFLQIKKSPWDSWLLRMIVNEPSPCSVLWEEWQLWRITDQCVMASSTSVMERRGTNCMITWSTAAPPSDHPAPLLSATLRWRISQIVSKWWLHSSKLQTNPKETSTNYFVDLELKSAKRILMTVDVGKIWQAWFQQSRTAW